MRVPPGKSEPTRVSLGEMTSGDVLHEIRHLLCSLLSSSIGRFVPSLYLKLSKRGKWLSTGGEF